MAEKLQVFMESGDTLIDFSCGSNDFLPILKRKCLKVGKQVFGIAYDIITPRFLEDFVLQSWFDVQPGRLMQTVPFKKLLDGHLNRLCQLLMAHN